MWFSICKLKTKLEKNISGGVEILSLSMRVIQQSETVNKTESETNWIFLEEWGRGLVEICINGTFTAKMDFL